MKFLNRFSRYLYQLSLSYVVIVLVITVVLGLAGYSLFRNAYIRAISVRDDDNLDYLAEAIETQVLYELIQFSSTMLTSEFSSTIPFFFENPLPGNHDKALELYYRLVSVVSSSTLLTRASVFFDRGEFLVSSEYGLIFPAIPRALQLPRLDWLNAVALMPSVWLPPWEAGFSALGESPDEIGFVKRHPVGGGARKAIVALGVRTDLLVAIFRGYNNVSAASIALVDHTGRLIAWYQDSDGPPRDAALRAIEDRVHNAGLVVSRRTLQPVGWQLVRVTSTDRFSSEIRSIRSYFVLICLGVLCIGLLVSFRLSRTVYGPVHRIIALAKRHVGHHVDQEDVAIIGEAFSSLTMVARNAEQILETNRPIFREHLVHKVIHGELVDHREFEQNAALVGWARFVPRSIVVGLVRLETSLMRAASFTDGKFARYDLIAWIESCEDGGMRIAAAELVTHDIAVVFFGDDTVLPAARLALKNLLSYCKSRQLSPAKISLGEEVDGPAGAGHSYETALIAAEYLHYLPQSEMLEYCAIATRETFAANNHPHVLVSELESTLPKMDLEETLLALDRIRNGLVVSELPLETCRSIETAALAAISDFAARLGVSGGKVETILRPDPAGSFDDLDELITFLKDVVREIYADHDSQISLTDSRVVESVRGYIVEHMRDELSAPTLSAHVGISSTQLGAVMKRVSASSVPAYINAQRLKKAQELLYEGPLTIKEIAFEVGYQSPTYFIRCFTKEFGMSPDRYRNLYRVPEK